MEKRKFERERKGREKTGKREQILYRKLTLEKEKRIEMRKFI